MQYYSKQLRPWKWKTKSDDMQIYAVITQGMQSVSSDIFEELKRDQYQKPFSDVQILIFIINI